VDHSVAPAAHRFGGRFTWLNSQWKLRAYTAQFWVEINSNDLEKEHDPGTDKETA
jgi:hypothetical protein